MQMRARDKSWSAVLALAIGFGGTLACTAASKSSPSANLPRAGSKEDDGTGILAQWSRGDPTEAGRRCDGEDCAGGDYDYEDPYYGGDYYGYYGGDYYGYYGGDWYGYYGGDYYGYGGDIYGYGYGYGYSPQPYVPMPNPVDTGYVATAVNNGGSIEGTVTWKAAPRADAALVARGTDCPESLANPTLARSASGGVGYTLVYLADISYGKTWTTLGGVVEQKGCELSPHVQLAAPIGTTMTVSNQDPAPRRVRMAAHSTDASLSPLLNTTLAQGKQQEVALLTSGTYEVSSSDHPAAIAWVVVPRHPYYAISDENGNFRLDDIPPGEYTLVAWHEPVATAADAETGVISRGQPVEVRTRVKVAAGVVTISAIDLK